MAALRCDSLGEALRLILCELLGAESFLPALVDRVKALDRSRLLDCVQHFLCFLLARQEPGFGENGSPSWGGGVRSWHRLLAPVEPLENLPADLLVRFRHQSSIKEA